jgi:hypothetical protein
MCCTCSIIGCNNKCWGCTFNIIDKTCNNIYEDERVTNLKKINKKNINLNTFLNICNKYMNEFDKQVSLATIDNAHTANIIREKLVGIIRDYSPGIKYMFLQDTNNIEELKNIIIELNKN